MALAGALLMAAACSGRGLNTLRLPDLKPVDISEPINIRVAFAELPGAPVLSEKDARQYFRILKETTKTYTDATVNFPEKPDRVPMEAFFLRYMYEDEYIELKKKQMIDPRKPGAEDALVAAIDANMVPANVDSMMQQVKDGVEADVIASKCIYPDKCLRRIADFRKDKFDSEEKLRKALEKYVPPADYADLENAVRNHPQLSKNAGDCTNQETCTRLIATYHINWLKRFMDIKNSDGKMLFAKAYQYMQYQTWDRLAMRQKDYDLVITNFPIASADIATPWQVSLRAGLDTGITSQSPGPLGGMIVMSMYPFFADNEPFNELRGGPPEITALDDFAWYTTHEMGHLLRRWGHPVPAQAGCVMTPITDINYAKWVNDLKANGKCDPAPPKLKRF